MHGMLLAIVWLLMALVISVTIVMHFVMSFKSSKKKKTQVNSGMAIINIYV